MIETITETGPETRTEQQETSTRYRRSAALFERARQLIPAGGHLSGRPLLSPYNSPLYIERGAGARCWDIDGNQYIDYFMAFGPFLLGYAHPRVDNAVIEQLRKGNLLSLNHPLHVKFAERMLTRFPSFGKLAFFKTGSEATTAALRIARRYSGRRKVVRCGYHGWHDWCLPLEPFVPQGLEQQVLEFDANVPTTLHSLFEAHPGQIGAIIVAPEMVRSASSEIFDDLLRISHDHGAVFILDEVKTGFRIQPGSFHEYVGLEPDIVTFSKALGNGWPVAAVLGRDEIMECAAGMHFSATYHGETSGIAAALATLDVLESEDVCGHVWRLGQLLIDGLNALAGTYGVAAKAYGEPLPPMPFLRFTGDAAYNSRAAAAFYASALSNGVLFHPRHLWFVSLAHTDADIAYTLDVSERAFAAAARA